jgi:ABC-2 type transport system ATP-binding protein
MIEVDRLSKFYGTVAAIQDVSFQVERGEILGFLGPNGAGKTTTMRILTGYFPATSGTARVAGFDVFRQLDEVRKRIGYLPENVPLYTDLSVESYLDFVGQIKGLVGKDRKQAVNKVIGECGLDSMRRRLIKKLSKGFRQRVGLAQALVNDPEVLILDEPTVGLDPRQIKEIRSLVKELAGKRTVILSTHILPEVSVTCSKVVIINQGRIITSDTLANLTQQNATNTEILVTVKGSPQKAEQAIRGVAGVLSVVTDMESRQAKALGTNGDLTLRVGIPTDPDLRGKVAKAVTDSGVDLIDLRSREVTLEDVFIRCISAQEKQRESEGSEGTDNNPSVKEVAQQ